MKIFLALLLLLVSLQANACGCDKPRSIADLREPSMVFKGEVVSIVKHKRSGGLVRKGDVFAADFSTQDVTFKVLELYQ